MKPRALFLSLLRRQEGATAAVFAVAFLALFAVTAGVIEMARLGGAHNHAQSALDNAGLAAVISSDNVSVQQEADNFFRNNFSAAAYGAAFDPVQVQQDGDRYIFTVHGRVPLVIGQALGALGLQFGSNGGMNLLLRSVVSRDVSQKPTDVAMVLDVSTQMRPNNLIGSEGVAASRISGYVYRNDHSIDNLTFSVIPYSEAVRFPPQDANEWLRNPYGAGADYDGCLNLRGNSLDRTDTPPVGGDPNQGFLRYMGPFDSLDDVNRTARAVFYDVAGVPHFRPSRTYEMPTGFRTLFTNADNSPMDPQNPLLTPQSSFTAYNLFRPWPDPITPANAGRYNNELDYIDANHKEMLEFNLGRQFLVSDVDFWISKLEFNSPVDYFDAGGHCHTNGTQGEAGAWAAIDGAGANVPNASGTFTPHAAGIYFGYRSPATPAQINSPSYRFIAFPAKGITNPFLNEGVNYCARSPNNSANTTWAPNFPVREDSDFAVWGFDYQPRCINHQGRGIPQVDLALNTRDQLNNSIVRIGMENTLGESRSQIGMMWAWNALSPKWRSIIQPGNPVFPREGSRKIAILMTRGTNFNPATDDPDFVHTCQAMKAQGIEIFTVGFAPSGPARGLLAQCATDSQHAFAANTGQTDEVEAIARQIARSLVQVHLVE